MYRTIVATYQGLSDTSALRQELESAGIARDRVRISSDSDDRTRAAPAPGEEYRPGGIFDWLFGVPDDEVNTYRGSIEQGHTIVTVHAEAGQAGAVEQILERYEPVDMDRPRTTGAPLATEQPAALGRGADRLAESGARREAAQSERIPVVEEDIKVGKRAVERGGVRVRSYVVERPFEELVRLRDETIRVERRPIADTAPVGADAFKERSFEMRERDEEAVIQKTARVKEEVVVSKDVGERTEQVRDKVRRTQVDVEKEPETVGTAGPASRERR
jgi:stress response protein YsnF